MSLDLISNRRALASRRPLHLEQPTDLEVAADGSHRFRARCSCGWRSNAVPPEEVIDLFEQHRRDPAPHVTALIVDDDADMRLLVRGYLTRAGLTVVEEAIDGPEALAAVSRLDPPPVPTVIVLDNRMPAMTGLEFAARMLELVPGQRIVLFSAHLTPEIEAEAAELGISACVHKTALATLPAVVAAVANA